MLIALVASLSLVVLVDGRKKAKEVVPEVKADDEDSEEVVVDKELPDEIEYSSPQLDRENLPYFLYEHFDDEEAFNRKWIRSKATKSESEDQKYDGEWVLTESHSRVKGK